MSSDNSNPLYSPPMCLYKLESFIRPIVCSVYSSELLPISSPVRPGDSDLRVLKGKGLSFSPKT